MPNYLLAVLAFAPVTGALQDQPVFRANTQLVQINVIARDKNGPVTNLTKGDFVLTDRGKFRTISVFSVHKALTAAEGVPRLPENTFSNRSLSGPDAPAGVTMILLDRLNTLVGGTAVGELTPLWNGDLALANAKQHLLKFVDELDPKERVAIYSLGRSLTVLSDFTGDREQLRTILNNYAATSITSREVAEPTETHACVPGVADGCSINRPINQERQVLASMANATRVQTTMTALLAMAAHAAGIPGRKNLVWLTADLVLPGEAVGRALSRSNIAIYPMDARGLLPATTARTAWDNLSNQMIGPGAAVMLGSRGATQPAGIGEMQILAEETGGRAFTNSNDLTGAIHQAIDDGAVTYTLGFYIDKDALDGKFHDLKVRVKRPSLDVRTQKGYFALKEAGENAVSPLTLAMTSPLESSAIHVLARVERAGAALSLSGSIDVRDLQLEQSGDSSKGAVEIHLVQQDAAGNVLERKHQTMQLQLTRAEYDGYLKSGVFFRGTVDPKEGLKTLRVIVIDRAAAAAGSLIVPVAAIK